MAQPKAAHKFEASLTDFAKKSRKSPTSGEKLLWKEFQKLGLSHGLRFRRQQPIGHYIADFYCAAYKCAVEIDGISHETKIEKDKERDLYFKELEIKTFRFSEYDTMRNPTAIIDTILHSLNLPTPPLSPPSRGGV